ncbi:MAG: hypothetical protein EAX86_13300 [Candidatus Heimdallarchaeota archaeon]|nr:hypothetical protein [Candidatus Heimdallarchaeota archaeon]
MEISETVEPIAHLEWTLGLSLICLSIWEVTVTPLGFLLLGVGSVFPDLFDWAFFHGRNFSIGHRELSHTVFFFSILIFLSIVIPILGFLTFGSILHLLEDIIAGRDPIYLFSPLTHRGGIMLIDRDQSIRIGGKIRSIIKSSYIGSENIGDELSWFWGLTILGAWIMALGIFFYFI